jgi:hypothetical protein
MRYTVRYDCSCRELKTHSLFLKKYTKNRNFAKKLGVSNFLDSFQGKISCYSYPRWRKTAASVFMLTGSLTLVGFKLANSFLRSLPQEGKLLLFAPPAAGF